MRVSDFRLGNGLRVLVAQNPGLESIGVSFGTNFGSIDEKPGSSGSAHFIEHMLFKGTQKRTWKDISDFCRQRGLEANAFTEREFTNVHIKTPKEYFWDSLELLSDIVKNSSFPPDEVEKERGPLVNENAIHDDDPFYFAVEQFMSKLFKEHPVGRSPGGSKKDIERVDRNVLFSEYKGNYTPGNSVLCVYGGVNKEDVEKVVKKHFSDFVGKTEKAPIKPAPAENKKADFKVNKEGIKDAIVAVGLKLPSVASGLSATDEAALTVVSKLLSNRLFDDIRERLGLSYVVDSAAMFGRFFGVMAGIGSTNPNNVDKVRKEIVKEFATIASKPIESLELERVKTLVSTGFKFHIEDTSWASIAMAVEYLLRGDLNYITSYTDRISRLSGKDVSAAIAKHVSVDRLSSVTVLA